MAFPLLALGRAWYIHRAFIIFTIFMFKRDDAGHEIETIIGPTVKVEGDFAAAGDVVVEGAVSGQLRTEQSLRIGEQAKITANVSAGAALVAGEIVGNVTVRETLEITSTGKIFGDIRTKVLAVAAGAQINGKVEVGEHRARTEPKPREHVPDPNRPPLPKAKLAA
ncbi:MAG: hypothetical protein G01um101431_665 [Parcubacteria group bacterium Gr01-1014_31]|nr:MAG: hypothetical protein G01um101431_665 [Parcubacteria group bacterium Gr01-1014_31]